VRGIRDVIVAVSWAALGGGVLFANTGLLVSGVIFLGEEFCEVGVVLLALRGPAGRVGADTTSGISSPLPDACPIRTCTPSAG
jgi:hypothetical protein